MILSILNAAEATMTLKWDELHSTYMVETQLVDMDKPVIEVFCGREEAEKYMKTQVNIWNCERY